MPLPSHVAGGDELVADVAVVGAGIAGLVAALDLLEVAPSASVVLVDKGLIGGSGSTPLAQGGLAAAVGADDDPALHLADTLRAADGLADVRAAAVVAAEAPDRVADLRRRGARFDVTADGALALAREGGQRVARSVRSADATGAEIARALRAAALDAVRREPGRLARIQGAAVQLAVTRRPDRGVAGVWVLLDRLDDPVAGPAQQPGLVLLRTKAVVLATGGCGGLYAATTNVDAATGDALALASMAGADLVDLEFVQFHPTGLKAGGARQGSPFQRFLLTEALRGAGAHLLDRDGHRFLPALHPDAELAPRHVVAKAILDQPGGAWLDARMLSDAQLAEEFPNAVAGTRAYGFDLAREPVPVEPCEHYMIGGVATDLHGRTTVPALYAAGEAACTGVHGANRMAGNSLAQSCVFAHRAALALRDDLARPLVADELPPPAVGVDGDVDLAALRTALRHAMSEGAGAIRDGEGLTRLAGQLADLRQAVTAAWGGRPPLRRDALELDAMLTAARLITASALLRTESRGAHWRTDHPAPEPAWAGRRLRITGPPEEDRDPSDG